MFGSGVERPGKIVVSQSKWETMTKQLALDLHLRDEFNFNSYLSSSNEQLVAALSTLRADYPLYFWGETGSGKTHLLHAVLNQQVSQSKAVALISLDHFDRPDSKICEGLEQCDLVCIDAINAVDGDMVWQQALFHLLNRAKENNTTMVISGHCSPQHLEVFADLQSRLAASLIFEQNTLNDDEKTSALQQRSKMRGLSLSDEVANYLVSRAKRDTHSLFGLLDKLDKHSMVKQRGLTVPLVKEVLFGSA